MKKLRACLLVGTRGQVFWRVTDILAPIRNGNVHRNPGSFSAQSHDNPHRETSVQTLDSSTCSVEVTSVTSCLFPYSPPGGLAYIGTAKINAGRSGTGLRQSRSMTCKTFVPAARGAAGRKQDRRARAHVRMAHHGPQGHRQELPMKQAAAAFAVAGTSTSQ